MTAKQLSIGDLCTSDVIALMHQREEKKRSKEKPEDVFAFQCRARKLPLFVQQFEIVKTDQTLTALKTPRKRIPTKPLTWKFDFCFPVWKLIVEIDGGIWMPGGGAHSHPVDLKRNMHKRNDAAHAGFHVLAFSPDEVKKAKRTALEYTMRVLHARGWKP